MSTLNTCLGKLFSVELGLEFLILLRNKILLRNVLTCLGKGCTGRDLRTGYGLVFIEGQREVERDAKFSDWIAC